MSKFMRLGIILATVGFCFLVNSLPAQDSASEQDQKALYRPLKIFDPARGSQITPIQRAAQERIEREKEQRRSLTSNNNLITYDIDVEGETVEDALNKAMVRALKAASARIYFDEYLIVGLDYLEPYLSRFGSSSIARTTILEQRILPENRSWVRARVSVNLDQLYPDLREKRFVGQPNLRPLITVHLEEEIEGSPGLEAGARERVESTMERSLFRVFSRDMREPPLNVDLTQDPELLQAARLEAQRHNIDVIISGNILISPVKDDKIYFDDFNFQSAEIRLKMYRVDNGELLAETEHSYSAPGYNKGEAINALLDAMVVKAAERLATQLRADWPYKMLNSSDKRLMLTGVMRDDVENVRALLKTFSPDIQIYEKSFYGDVAVLNVVIPRQLPEPLEVMLEEAREPQMNIRRIDDYKIELEVL